MERAKGTTHILMLDEKEMSLIREAMQFFHECTVKSQEFKQQKDDATIKRAIEIETICQGLGIPGYEFS